jgi:pimeloyl-ACP methyl ester carboxylesterase
VTDLQALIQAAKIDAPVLLVGHSLGSNIVRSYARRHPDLVAGMVLVDPPEQGADEQMPRYWQSQVATLLAQREEFLGHCERAAEMNDEATLQRSCLRAHPEWMSETVAAAITRNKSKPSYWRTLRSELAHNVDLFAAQVPDDESYGSIPLVLLVANEQHDDVPDDVRTVINAARQQTHRRILAASTRSSKVEVQDSSHDIQWDRPEAVVTAVQGLLRTGAGSDMPAGGD